jgi:hypothetical protein
MPVILTATVREMLALTGTNAATLRNDRRRGHMVAAFGAADTALPGRYFVIDAVAVALRNELVDNGLRLKDAAALVRAYFDHWIAAVAHIEHRQRAWLWAVAETETAGVWWSASGPADEFLTFIKNQPRPKRLILVNVPKVLDGILKRAAKAKLDLSTGSFFLPPEHELFIEWTSEHRKRREAGLRRHDPLYKYTPTAPTMRTIGALLAFSGPLQ